MSSEAFNFETIIEKIISYKGTHDQRYIDKFSKEAILKLIDEEEKMDVIQSRLAQYEPAGVDILCFVRNLLDILPHSYDETLYLAMAIIEIFRDACERLNLNNMMRAGDFSNYTVDKFLNRNITIRGAFTKKLPKQKKFQEETSVIRDIDIQAPVVMGNTFKNVKRLIASKITSDRARHKNKGIKKACFGPEAKKAFILDDFSNYIFVANLEGEAEKTLYAKGNEEKQESMIVDLAWSSRQGRLGVTLNDMTLSFWDSIDNFEFEKSFSIINSVSEYQTNIWYIEFLNMWITADKTGALTSWDILNETKIFTLRLEKLSGTIIDIAQLEVIKLLLVATSDNKLSLVDVKKGVVMTQIEIPSGIRSICWSATYQVLMTVGWENTIKLWQIDQKYLDITEFGKLLGHTGLITAIGAIESTPMLVSTDDLGVVKIWDARSLECLQTTQFQLKDSIRQIVDMYSHNRLGIVGHRVYYIEFDDADKAKQEKEQEELYPLGVEYNPNLEELLICSKKDVRCIDIENGQVKRVYEGLLTNEKDDITVFKMMQKHKKFIVGDDKGNLLSFDVTSGERLRKLASHTNEITSVKLDHANNLIISGGWDSCVRIQKEGGDTNEVKRSFKNLHHHKAVSLMEVSLYHSLLVTASNNHMLYVWDYEFSKLLAIVEGQEGSEFTYLQFINGYSTLLAADTTGKIHFLHLTRSDPLHVSVQTLASIKIPAGDDKEDKNDKNKDGPTFVTKILVNLEYKDYQENTADHKMYISTNKGDVKSYNLSSFFQSGLVKMSCHVNQQASYNPERIIHEDFTAALRGYVSPPFKIGPSHEGPSSSMFSSLSRNIEQGLCEDFQAHDDALTTLAFLSISDRKLLTSALDSFMKIWTLEGCLVASIKINEPLPVLWNLKEEASSFKDKRKILCTIKLVESIFKKYSRDMTLREKASISIKEFCESLSSSTKKKPNRGTIRNKPLLPELPLVFESKKVTIMNDEYTPRDHNYESFKDLYKKDFQGPSLKEQDVMKKLIMRNQAFNESPFGDEKAEERYRKKAEREVNKSESPKQKNNDRFLEFLLKDVPLFDSQEYTLPTIKLSAKLTKSVQPSPMKGNVKIGEVIILNKPPSLKRLSYNNSPTCHSPKCSRHKKKLSIGINELNLKNMPTNLDSPAHSSTKSIQSARKLSPIPRKSGLILDQSSFLKTSRNQDKMPIITPKRRPQGKSTERANFYDYAAQKLNNGHDETPSSVSLFQSQNLSTASTNKTCHLDRVQQRKNFHSIMNKLKIDVIKSQFTPKTHRNMESVFDPVTLGGSQTSRMAFDKLQDRTTMNTPQESNDFLNELNNLKQDTLDKWKLQMSEQERKDRYITELMVKNIKKPSLKPADNVKIRNRRLSPKNIRQDGLEQLFTAELGFTSSTKNKQKPVFSIGGDLGF